MDLIVYCLSLGLEEDTLNRLISLRNEAYPNRAIINPDTPNFGEQEHEVTKLLREFLRDSAHRLTNARANEPIPKRIPRQMLLDVNNDLAKLNLPTLF